MGGIDPSKPKRRLSQLLRFQLRSLFVLTLLIASGVSLWKWLATPFEEDRKVRRLIETLGCTYRTEPGGATWQRALAPDLFQNCVDADMSSAEFDEAWYAGLLRLPRLQTLVVAGWQYEDRHLKALAALPHLQGVLLDSTAVTEDGLRDLAGSRPDLFVARLQDRAMRRFGGDFADREGIGLRNRDVQRISTRRKIADRRFHSLFPNRPSDVREVALLTWTPRCATEEPNYLRTVPTLRWLELSCEQKLPLSHLSNVPKLQGLSFLVPRPRPDNAIPISADDFVQFGEFRKLEFLAVAVTRFSEDVATMLCDRSPNLEILHLVTSQLGDRALQTIVDRLDLTELSIYGDNAVTDAGLIPLRKCSKLRRLLIETASPLTARGLDQLRNALRGCIVDVNQVPSR